MWQFSKPIQETETKLNFKGLFKHFKAQYWSIINEAKVIDKTWSKIKGHSRQNEVAMHRGRPLPHLGHIGP